MGAAYHIRRRSLEWNRRSILIFRSVLRIIWLLEWQPPETTVMTVPWWFITTDKILISIHRTAIIIWVIKIIRTAGTISSKQNCLRCKSLQRVGIKMLICPWEKSCGHFFVCVQKQHIIALKKDCFYDILERKSVSGCKNPFQIVDERILEQIEWE